MTKKPTKKTVVKQKEQEVDVQPKFDKNGVQIEQNVFPPIDDSVEFEGTGAGQRQLRQQLEAQEDNDKK